MVVICSYRRTIVAGLNDLYVIVDCKSNFH